MMVGNLDNLKNENFKFEIHLKRQVVDLFAFFSVGSLNQEDL